MSIGVLAMTGLAISISAREHLDKFFSKIFSLAITVEQFKKYHAAAMVKRWLKRFALGKSPSNPLHTLSYS